MGLLMDFYVGDQARIAEAWQGGDLEALAAPGVVAVHVDLSFHLSPEDLDELLLAACDLAGRPPMRFTEAIRGEVAPQAESGLQELTDAFRDLLAGIPVDQAGMLYDRWLERCPRPAPPSGAGRAPLAKARRGLEALLFKAILWPVLAGAWLFSADFRKARRKAQAEQAIEAAAPAPTPGPSLRQGVAALLEACRTAKARGATVLYAWSL